MTVTPEFFGLLTKPQYCICHPSAVEILETLRAWALIRLMKIVIFTIVFPIVARSSPHLRNVLALTIYPRFVPPQVRTSHEKHHRKGDRCMGRKQGRGDRAVSTHESSKSSDGCYGETAAAHASNDEVADEDGGESGNDESIQHIFAPDGIHDPTVQRALVTFRRDQQGKCDQGKRGEGPLANLYSADSFSNITQTSFAFDATT
jgi:hypothetical protein